MTGTFLLFLHRRVEILGASVLEFINGLGRFSQFSAKVIYWSFKPPFRFKLFFEQMHFVGNKSVFIICLAGSFTGAVMAYQTYFGFQVISGDTFVGPIVAIALAKELAPVLTGLIVAGRAGAAMAAQIGSMKVTEQIDALEVMSISSLQYLGTPRIIAGTLTLPLLSIIFLLVGNFGSWIIGTRVLMIDEVTYYKKLGEFLFVADLFQGIIKAVVFGFLISLIGVYHGFAVKGGAEGVGKGTNLAVVWGMIVVLVVDLFLTSFLVKIL